MKVSIIIPTYNTPQMAIECIQSLFDYKNECDIEIVVVDNGSDNSHKLIHGKFPHIKVIKNAENMGYGYAINQGIKVTDGEFILMLNSDTLAKQDNWIDEMINTFDDKTAVVGNRLINRDNQLVGCGVMGTNAKPIIRGWKEYNDHNKYNKVCECISVCGACYMIKRSNIEKLGMLDENLIFYFEETSYSYNARRNGFKVLYCPTSELYHFHQGSSKDNLWLNQQFIKGKQYFDEKFKDMMEDTRKYE